MNGADSLLGDGVLAILKLEILARNQVAGASCSREGERKQNKSDGALHGCRYRERELERLSTE